MHNRTLPSLAASPLAPPPLNKGRQPLFPAPMQRGGSLHSRLPLRRGAVGRAQRGRLRGRLISSDHLHGDPLFARSRLGRASISTSRLLQSWYPLHNSKYGGRLFRIPPKSESFLHLLLAHPACNAAIRLSPPQVGLPRNRNPLCSAQVFFDDRIGSGSAKGSHTTAYAPALSCFCEAFLLKEQVPCWIWVALLA